jgi:hypothetical protein
MPIAQVPVGPSRTSPAYYSKRGGAKGVVMESCSRNDGMPMPARKDRLPPNLRFFTTAAETAKRRASALLPA